MLEEAHKEIAIVVKDGDAVRHDLIRIENLATMSAARRKALGV